MENNKLTDAEYIHLSDISTDSTYDRIYSIWKTKSDNKEKSTSPFYLNFKDVGVKELFKYYDNPLKAEKITNRRLKIVRPKQQTKAERQTGVYQLEQIFDILDGATMPNTNIVILIDKDFNSLMYVYDGQHQTLSFLGFLCLGKKFKLDDLISSIHKKEIENFEFEYSKVWTTLKSFSENFSKLEFNIDDIIEYHPEFENITKDKNRTGLKGTLHFTTAKGASALMKKLNEHISSHSTSQRIKTDLNGTPLDSLLFDNTYSTNNKSGLLSDFIPDIQLFNRTNGNSISKLLPKTFSYELDSKDYVNMNYDQYLILFYNLIACRVHIKHTDVSAEYHFLPNKKNSAESVVRGYGTKKWWDNEVWTTYGIKAEVHSRYMAIFKDLIISDTDASAQYVQNIISLAEHSTKKEFVQRLDLFNTKLKVWSQKYKDKQRKLLEESNVISKEQLNEELSLVYDRLSYEITSINDLRFSSGYQFVNLCNVILDTLPASQPIGEWSNAVLSVMIDSFDKYFINNEDKFISQKNQTKTSLKRYSIFNELFTVRSFTNEVNEYSSSTDTSLWSKTEAKEYFTNILKHSDSVLYRCPHSGELITLTNFESHHLSFRSKSPQKEFKFWFPLSSKFNNYIRDSYDKNIVDTNGDFVDACDYMIDLCNTQIKKYEKSGNVENVLDYEDTISIFNKWKKRAKYVLGK
jgi:hypothetical protein